MLDVELQDKTAMKLINLNLVILAGTVLFSFGIAASEDISNITKEDALSAIKSVVDKDTVGVTPKYFTLGQIYENGLYVDVDVKKAMIFYSLDNSTASDKKLIELMSTLPYLNSERAMRLIEKLPEEEQSKFLPVKFYHQMLTDPNIDIEQVKEIKAKTADQENGYLIMGIAVWMFAHGQYSNAFNLNHKAKLLGYESALPDREILANWLSPTIGSVPVAYLSEFDVASQMEKLGYHQIESNSDVDLFVPQESSLAGISSFGFSYSEHNVVGYFLTFDNHATYNAALESITQRFGKTYVKGQSPNRLQTWLVNQFQVVSPVPSQGIDCNHVSNEISKSMKRIGVCFADRKQKSDLWIKYYFPYTKSVNEDKNVRLTF
jgi:hypothetical protein